MGLARIVKGKRTTKTGGASITVSINESPARDHGILERYVEWSLKRSRGEAKGEVLKAPTVLSRDSW